MPSQEPSRTFAELALKGKPRRQSQLTFDLTPPAPAPEPPKPPTLYTVRQLIADIRNRVESLYPAQIHVEGEISNCRPAASGHLYFTLKDGEAQLPIVIFRRQAQLLGFKIRDGLHVEAHGRIAVYETRGQIQLIAETLRPRGEGALQLAYEALKRKLAAENLFDRKRPLPPFPRCIGIVTSPHGAAIRDIIHIVRRRHARLNILIYPAPMQGPQCAPAVAAGIRYFNRMHADQQGRVPHSFEASSRKGGVLPSLPHQIPCVDLILITRGGGSFEDLNGFNDERLARVIHASVLPVVSAVGHEIDHTIADFVADLRAPTPSAAAELITAAQHRIEDRVVSLEKRVHRASELHLLRARRRLERLSADQVLRRLRDGISLRQQKIDELRFRLTAALRASSARRQRTHATRLAALETRLQLHNPKTRLALAQRRLQTAAAQLNRLRETIVTRPQTRLAQVAGHLEALSPLAVLNRGYAIVYAADGSILRDPAQTQPNAQITARLAKGTVRARIEHP